ncbi:MarR family winged helix-turn-helix transcriptional regulator [Mesorhizobium amorphae]|uniref:MarR family winged helix-turn-helix transcriptional regulator n=1 Tax=Mesorhizobium amorphae TaxID=71433 RepID=UPI0011841318|nr:MarR family transcriptional regulator [Mesorhizobium amorphae]
MKEHFSQANILDEMTEIVLRMEDVFEAEFGEFGLSLAEGQTLYGLVRTGAGSQKQLADRLRIEPPTFARLIRRLESRGLVWRFEADGDRRAKQLLLTAEGRDLVATIKRKTAGNLAKLVSGVIVSELETAQASSVALPRMSESCRATEAKKHCRAPTLLRGKTAGSSFIVRNPSPFRSIAMAKG